MTTRVLLQTSPMQLPGSRISHRPFPREEWLNINSKILEVPWQTLPWSLHWILKMKWLFLTEPYRKRDFMTSWVLYADYTKSIEHNPQYAAAYFNRALAKDRLPDRSGAISDYSKALELEPDNTEAYLYRGINKIEMEDYRGAIADFTKAIELNPADSKAYEYRGIAKSFIKDNKGAIADQTKAIKADPNNSGAYFNMGIAKIHSGQKEKGCLDLSKAGELGHKSAYDVIKELCN